MSNLYPKRLLLAALMITLSLSLAGCFITPDPIDNPAEISTESIVPLPTDTASPAPTPEEDDDAFFAWATKAPPNTAVLSTAPPTQSITPALSPTATAAAITTDMLKEGAEGQQVHALQQRLTELGYYARTLDGAFGPATASALKDFQRANGLSADGIAGPKTIEVLFSESAKPK